MYEINKDRFGSFVAERRKAKGLTQKGLAEQLFISDKAVSKWERGTSMPDISLLIPLAELLEVSVSELLEGRLLDPSAAMNPQQSDQLIKTVIQLSSANQRGILSRKKRRVLFLLCLAASCVEVFCIFYLGHITSSYLISNLSTPLLLAMILGGVSCFLTKDTLPAYYDENKISAYYTGPFRLNLPGVYMNNRNWPHILQAMEFCFMAILVGFPPLFWLLFPLWPPFGLYITLLVLLGGLFLPLYIVGKKHE